MDQLQNEKSMKYSIIGSIVVAALMIALGYYLTKVAANDKLTQKCDSAWYIKIIGWLIIIMNAITFCVSGYMYYNLK